MKVLRNEIVIDAPPERVWAQLMDFDCFPDWNPFVVRAAGEVVEGSRLRVTLSPPGGRTFSLKPHVTEVVPERVFEWGGHLGLRGVFDGRHRFELHPDGDGTRLVQAETFTGMLVPLLWRSLRTKTGAGFVAMNRAMKARVEGVPAEMG
jgi:hypothetical protein